APGVRGTVHAPARGADAPYRPAFRLTRYGSVVPRAAATPTLRADTLRLADDRSSARRTVSCQRPNSSTAGIAFSCPRMPGANLRFAWLAGRPADRLRGLGTSRRLVPLVNPSAG